jgi:hypothetical protein
MKEDHIGHPRYIKCGLYRDSNGYIVNRKVYNIFDVIQALGGFASSVHALFYLISHFYNRRQLKINLIAKSFYVDVD